MPLILKLYWEYFKVGLFSIGGGLATIPFLEELMNKTHWYTMEDLTNLIAVSECTPGPMGVNMATYVGNVMIGPIGGIVATLGLISPSIIIILLIAVFLKNFSSLPVVQNTFAGLRPASTALIAVACCSVAKVAVLDFERIGTTTNYLSLIKVPELILAAAIFAGIKIFKKHPVVYIVIAAAIGIIFKL